MKPIYISSIAILLLAPQLIFAAGWDENEMQGLANIVQRARENPYPLAIKMTASGYEDYVNAARALDAQRITVGEVAKQLQKIEDAKIAPGRQALEIWRKAYEARYNRLLAARQEYIRLEDVMRTARLKTPPTPGQDWSSTVQNQIANNVNQVRNNPNAAKATVAAVGTGAGVGVGVGTGTGLLAPVTGAGTLTIGAAVGAGLSTGLGIGCIYYERVYYNAVEKFNAACRYQQIERPRQIRNKEWNSWPTYQDAMNQAQIDMKTYGDLYNKCLIISLFRDPVPTQPKCE